jgi:putative ABC transport system substrate-binding protein
MRKKTKKVLVLTFCATMVLSLIACGNNSKKEKGTYTIGICQLIEHEALDSATKGFKDALTEKLGDKVNFKEQTAQGESATCTTIVNSFISSNVDLILANATAPLQAAANATSDIPIIGTSVTDYATALDFDNFTGSTGINVSGTCDLAPLDKQAEMLHELFPNAKKVGILYCSAEPNSKFQADKITEYLKEYGISCTNYSFVDSNDISAVTNGAVQNSDVIYIPTDNTAANNTEVIDSIARPAGVPIIAGERGICKGCGVATLSINYYDIGYEAGLMAYDILVNGADITTMDIKYAPNVTKQYNKEICDQLNITIPDDYTAIENDD